jgi:hypothetical protein
MRTSARGMGYNPNHSSSSRTVTYFQECAIARMPGRDTMLPRRFNCKGEGGMSTLSVPVALAHTHSLDPPTCDSVVCRSDNQATPVSETLLQLPRSRLSRPGISFASQMACSSRAQ